MSREDKLQVNIPVHDKPPDSTYGHAPFSNERLANLSIAHGTPHSQLRRLPAYAAKFL